MRNLALAAALLALQAGEATASVVTAEVYRFPGDRFGGIYTVTRVVFAAGAGEANAVTAGLHDGVMVVRDPGSVLTVGEGCRSSGEHEAACDVSGYGELHVTLGDQGDAFTLDSDAAGHVRVHGEDGDDRLDASLGPGSTMSGGAGSDVLIGGTQNTLNGGPGRDEVRGGPGMDHITDDAQDGSADVLDAGEGTGWERDRLSYERSVPVVVDLAQGAGGQIGETDTLLGFEEVYLGPGGGTVRGDDQDNWVWASEDANAPVRLEGRGGADQLTGGAGDDLLLGGPGTDSLVAGPAGKDLLFGEDDNDILVNSVAGQDVSAYCGNGQDQVTALTAPILIGRDCERVLTNALGGGSAFIIALRPGAGRMRMDISNETTSCRGYIRAWRLSGQTRRRRTPATEAKPAHLKFTHSIRPGSNLFSATVKPCARGRPGAFRPLFRIARG